MKRSQGKRGKSKAVRRRGRKASPCFWIYILELDNGHLYTGLSRDPLRRYRQHSSRNGGGRYTRSFKPVRLAQLWKMAGTLGAAMAVEALIKRRGRAFKEALLEDPRKLQETARRALPPAPVLEPVSPASLSPAGPKDQGGKGDPPLPGKAGRVKRAARSS